MIKSKVDVDLSEIGLSKVEKESGTNPKREVINIYTYL